MKKILLAGLLPFFAFTHTISGAAILPDTVVVPGEKYDRGFVHRFFWGSHYRKVWRVPVKVPYLNLQTEAGGLKPLVKGGSYQTKNLRMINPAGKEYVLRSIDKDPSQTLSPKRRDSYFGWLVRDQTSVVHPFGAFIIPPMAEAAGVFHTNPKLFVVPNDPALGEFRPEFANMLVMLEERPDGEQKDTPYFGNSEQVESSRKTFKKLVSSNKDRVDAREFLKARLFDMWLGDWSRREDQWRWATFKTPQGGTKYIGIPRDRDHAFFKFNDGFFTWIVSRFAHSLQSFGPKIKNLKGLNTAAAPMDRSLLVFLTKADFEQVGNDLKTKLTDAVIEQALKNWPPEVYAISGKEFERNLKNRRNQLPEVAEKYYKLLAKEVEIPGTDEKEIFKLIGQENILRIEMYRPGKKGNPDVLIDSRTFNKKETRSIDIYGLGGKDEFLISGTGNPIKHVKIFDGEGQDSISSQGKKKYKIKVMNSRDGNEIKKSKDLKIVKKYKPKAQEFDGEGWLLRHRLY